MARATQKYRDEGSLREAVLVEANAKLRVRRARSETRSREARSGGVAARSARDLFYAEFGHSDSDHRAATKETIDLSPEEFGAAVQRAGVGGNDGGGGLDFCGWWWCREKDHARVPWGDLRIANDILLNAGIDPRSRVVANIAGLPQLGDAWASERSGFEVLERALARLDGSLKRLDLTGSATKLRDKWRAELAPLLRNARDAKPSAGRSGGGAVKAADRRAMVMARDLGWSSDALAAALLLTGADRSGFSALRARLRVAMSRLDRSQKR